MATMALQISCFRCILRRQFRCSASATTAAAAAAAAAPTTTTTAAVAAAAAPPTTTTRTTRTWEGPLSTAPDSLSSLANFLVDSLEFSEKEALSISTELIKLRQSRGASKVCAPNFYRKADLVISFLEHKGLEKPQIRKLISSFPVILTYRIAKNLEPKVNCFLELGFSVSDYADIISTQPVILRFGLNSTLRPAIEALKEIMGSNENVVRVLKAFRSKSLRAAAKHLVRNVSLLRARGILIESLQKHMLWNPSPFIRKHEVFKDIVTRVEAKWRVSPRSKNFLVAVHVLCSLHERTIESKCRVFESFGWDRSHVVNLFRNNPHSLGLAEKNLKAKLRFFMNELGYDPGHFAVHRPLLCCSLEKRVMPRYLVFQVLKEKGLIRENLTFTYPLGLAEDGFLRRFILPFLGVVPDLHDIYVNSIQAATKEETTVEKNGIEA